MIWQALISFFTISSHYLSVDDADDGQGLVEYALLLALISVAMIALMTILGPSIGNIYSNIMASMDGVSS